MLLDGIINDMVVMIHLIISRLNGYNYYIRGEFPPFNNVTLVALLCRVSDKEIKHSPGPGHCDPLCEEAPLLPKLRDYFVKFLRESCLVPLGILYLPTCVGFEYRYPFVEGRSSFSWEYSMVTI
ncbi:hypothetical protein GQ457_02G018010 [Hibiscus cannabinus]